MEFYKLERTFIRKKFKKIMTERNKRRMLPLLQCAAPEATCLWPDKKRNLDIITLAMSA